MKIDLMDFVDSNKRIENLEKEVDFRKELNKLISYIIVGNDNFYTSNKDLVKKIGLKVEKVTNMFSNFSYRVELNRSNIKKTQKFIDNERYEDEDEY